MRCKRHVCFTPERDAECVHLNVLADMVGIFADASINEILIATPPP